jgi:alpha-L-glutamate ligase-like protein
MSTNNRRPWAWPSELRKSGVLGINQRNLVFIQESNRRALYPRVDDKTITKEICHKHGIPVPDTYCVIRKCGDVRRFPELIGDRSEFVVKPASGAGGRGIVVVARRNGPDFITSGGKTIIGSDLQYHLSTILSGLFSLGGQMDNAIVEQRIIIHPVLERIAVGGTPDIRVILYRSVPVMAMTRLPTVESQGRANLHQGAAAAAVHLVTGRTFGGVCHNRMISRHPDTGELIAGLEIPGWKDVLTAAMKLGDALEMGYVGVDFVVDAAIGPVVLEANARPGLAIQVAHRYGLLPRLRMIDSVAPEAVHGERRWELIARLAGDEGQMLLA